MKPVKPPESLSELQGKSKMAIARILLDRGYSHLDVQSILNLESASNLYRVRPKRKRITQAEE
jgi:hypothetical protein